MSKGWTLKDKIIGNVGDYVSFRYKGYARIEYDGQYKDGIYS